HCGNGMLTVLSVWLDAPTRGKLALVSTCWQAMEAFGFGGPPKRANRAVFAPAFAAARHAAVEPAGVCSPRIGILRGHCQCIRPIWLNRHCRWPPPMCR